MRVEYTSPDGSPFPVDFARADDAAQRWLLDREHAPDAMTPLAECVRRVGQPGAARAYDRSDLELPSPLRRELPRANGYEYAPDFVLPPAEAAAFEEGLAQLAQRHGGAEGVWREHILPLVQEACRRLGEAPDDTPFATLAELRTSAWSHTAVAGVVARRDLQAVAASCALVVGDHAVAVAHELAQGFPNDTIAADRAFGWLAGLAPGTTAEAAAREDFLAAYGSRAVSWSIDHPTPVEQPELLDAPLRLLRERALAPGGPGDIALGASARRRERAAAIRAALPDDAERRRFARRLERLAAFVPIREARARWQLVATGALRGLVRRRGRILAERGVLDDPDDVFLLTPSEYDQPTTADQPALEARREEHRRWSGVLPPPIIGRVDPEPAHAADPRVLHGSPGAPGVATGPARLLVGLADADRLEPGDVLVTTMTAPPWTPLFGIAAAVVTDAGDILSHVAIAAREYGIPCVVGTDRATRHLRDGEPLTVDGNAGTVRRER